MEGLSRYAHLQYFNLGNGSGDLTHRKSVSFLQPKLESEGLWFLEAQPESDYSYEIKEKLERYVVEVVGTPVYL